MKKTATFLLFILTILCSSVISETNTCYKQAADNIAPGKKIKLVTEQGKLSGELKDIDLLNNEITIDQQMNNNINSTVVSLENVSEIQYSERGRFQPKYVVLGTLGGIVLGGTVGYLASDNVDSGWEGTDDTAKAIATVGMAMVGGVVGLVVGAILPTELNSTVTIKCD